MTFLNAALLAGLAAVVIPPIVHLLNRRKFDVVDWAAMQFLQVSRRTKRKVFFEQFWLMALRVAVLVLLCLGFAAPQVTGRLFGSGSAGGPRDVVVLIDGSASMAYSTDGRTAAVAARDWAADYLGRLRSEDRVAVFQVKSQPVPVVAALSADHDQARNALELLTPPTGPADWPAAVQTALAVLDQDGRGREIVVVSDNQRFGWADETTLAKWDLVSRGRRRDAPDAARLWVVNVAADRPPDPPNGSLDPITTDRGVAAADREITFRSAVRLSGQGDGKRPGRVRLLVDGQFQEELNPTPAEGDVRSLSFARKFGTGSHLVTLQLEEDELPSDNRQDFAVEVLPAVPVLIVDGSAADGSRGGGFLRDALAPAKDPTPAFVVRTVAASEWSSASFQQDVSGPGTPPRVVVLANVDRLTASQQQEVEKFLNAGGSVLVAAGERCDAAVWNRLAFRGGQGFLPARLVEVVGGGDVADAPKVLTAGLAHPALQVFQDPLPGGLHTAYFPQRWKVDLAAGANGTTGVAVGSFTNREPFLIERAFGRGRVILSTHPLDNSWKTNLVRLPDYVRLAHELMYYLAGTRTAERNLTPGQPIVYTPAGEEPRGPVTVLAPNGRTRTVNAESWPVVIDGTTDPGAYKLTTPSGRTVYYAVRNDSREAVLTPAGEEDRQRVADAVGSLTYVTGADEIAATPGGRAASEEVWWVLLLAVIGLLATEVWYTRRLTDRGEHNLRA